MCRKLFPAIAIFILFYSACQPAPAQLTAPAPTSTATSEMVVLDYASAPADNPLNGFMPFYDAYSSRLNPIANDFPHSMEWFYVPLRNLMIGVTPNPSAACNPAHIHSCCGL